MKKSELIVALQEIPGDPVVMVQVKKDLAHIHSMEVTPVGMEDAETWPVLIISHGRTLMDILNEPYGGEQ